MEINVLIDEGIEECPEERWIRNIAEQVLIAQGAGSDVELGIVITGQERVQQLNRDYRGMDKPTDVLSFCMTPEEVPKTAILPFIEPPDGVAHLGEVIISCPQAIKQATEHHHSVMKEIATLIIHGVLHLLGYDHEETEQEQQMQAREKVILGSMEGF